MWGGGGYSGAPEPGFRRAGAWPAAPPGPVGAVGRWVRAFGAPEALMGRLGYVRGHLVAKSVTQCGLVRGQTGPRIVLKVYLLVI